MNNSEPFFQKFVELLKQRVSENYSNAYFTVKDLGVKPNHDTLSAIQNWQRFYIEIKNEHKKGVLSNDEWHEKLRTTIGKMNGCLDDLGTDELEEGILDSFKESLQATDNSIASDSEEEMEISSIDNLTDIDIELNTKNKVFLERIDINTIFIPENSDILDNSEKRYEFRKRMMDIQDLMFFKKYGKAFDECEYVLKNLELQSPQLYEYLIISYFKIKGREFGIVQDIENQNDESLRQLALYIFRCRLYNKNRDKTETLEGNIEYICYRIGRVLRQRYLAITFNYINNDDNPSLRLQIQRYIQMGIYVSTEIYKGNNPSTDFLEYALIELNGGGRLEWFDVTSDWQIRDKNSFPALHLRQKLITILKRNGTFEKCKTELYRRLNFKYSFIRIPQNGITVQPRKALIRFFKASIIAYKCFDDIRFLELFKEELLHNGKIHWFILDDSGNIPKVVANKECQDLGYDPYKEWLRIKPKFEQIKLDEATKLFMEDLKEQNKIERIKANVSQTDIVYEKCKRNNRAEIIECLRQWINAYKELPDEDYLRKCINVLIDESDNLFWFELDENANLINHKECNDLKFDAKYYLNTWMDSAPHFLQIKEAIWQKIKLRAAEIMSREADLTYQKYLNSNLE